jgi:lysophospholipase L1-like esterase
MKRALLTLAAVAALAVAGVLAEFAYRAVRPLDRGEAQQLESFRLAVRGEDAVYRALPHTSYGLNPAVDTVNDAGFRGPEWTVARTPGVPRILCLGASTTEGGNGAGYEGSYPRMLELALEEELGGDVEVLNAGVSGWTSAESLVAWFLTLQDYRPDVVVIHHAVNDVMPRNTPGFVPNYTHWRTPLRPPDYNVLQRLLVRYSNLYARRCMQRGDGALIALCAVPDVGPFPFRENDGSFPAETAEPFARNVRSIGRSAESQGAAVCLMTMPCRPPGGTNDFASFRVGMEEHNQILRRLCQENGWLLADAASSFPQSPDLDSEEPFLDLVHLRPVGNDAKAKLVAAALLAGWYPAWRVENQ